MISSKEMADAIARHIAEPEVFLPQHQFKALQMDIADALLHADIAHYGDYHVQHPDGSESLSDEGQEIFNGFYDQAETILIDAGIEPDG